jgi:hypothetical protein
MAVLLAEAEDLNTPGLDLFVDIDASCPMFFAAPWGVEQIYRAPRLVDRGAIVSRLTLN